MSSRLALFCASVALLPWAALAQDEPRKCTSPEWEHYLDSVRSRFYEFWQPPAYAPNITCRVLVKQNFRGEVLYVGIAKCTNDKEVHKSVTDAAYEMSPLPLPANKDCFRRDVIVEVESRSLSDGTPADD